LEQRLTMTSARRQRHKDVSIRDFYTLHDVDQLVLIVRRLCEAQSR
jgi:hypothetical protein